MAQVSPQVQAYTAYQVIPEGNAAIISFAPTTITDGESVRLNLRKTGTGASRASLSANSITLTSDAPTAQVMVTVKDNQTRQDNTLSFTITFTRNRGTLNGQTPGLPPALTFTIPANDLKVSYKEEPPAIITGTDQNFDLLIADLVSKKSFLVLPQDPDIVVSPPGVVSVMGNELSFALKLKEGSELTELALPSINLVHLDSLQGPSQSAIAAGDFHSCALKTNGEVECWGGGSDQQATEPNPNGPFVAISGTSTHNCAIKTSGQAQCWGKNNKKQAPAMTNGSFLAIAAGGSHSCALNTNGDARCWGSNASKQAPSLTNGHFLAIAAGGFHTCALKITGDAQCWGSTTSGQAQN